MYARRFSSISTPNPSNLKCAIKEKCLEKFSIARRSLTTHQMCSKLENMKRFNSAIDMLISKVKVFRTNFLNKTNPDRTLKIWIRQFEFVFAQRVRRGQQMFCMYSKWWEERALKEFIKRFRVNVNRNGKRLFMGSIGVSLYNWEENRIKDEEFTSHLDDLMYVETLKDNTICLACTNEKVKSNSRICKCGIESNSNRTYDDWALFIEKDDLIVWRRLYKNGLYEYKVYGSYYDVSAEDFLNVQVDTNYRKEWDTTAIQLEIGERDPDPESSSDILYWEMQWPRLFVNRDYVFNRRYKVFNDSQTLMIINKTTEYPQFPRYPDKYRVEEYWSCMVIKPYTDMKRPGIEFSLTYFDNPGVNIPSTVTTWVAKSAMPDFLNKLRTASRKYKEYCLLRGTTKACEIVIKEEKERKEAEERDKLDYCSNIRLVQRFSDVFDDMQNVINEKFIRKPDIKITTAVTIKRDTDQSLPKKDEHLNYSSNLSKETNNSSNSNTTFWKYLHPLYYFT